VASAGCVSLMVESMTLAGVCAMRQRVL
jgi:hypothetical protein